MWELSWILLALHSITAVKSQRLVIGDWITVEFDTNFPLTQIGRYNSGWYNAITPETMLIVAFSFGFTRASHPIRHDKITSQWPQVNSCDRQWKYPTDQNPSSSRIVLELRARVYPENGLPFRKKKNSSDGEPTYRTIRSCWVHLPSFLHRSCRFVSCNSLRWHN